jgi:hypothetical protein
MAGQLLSASEVAINGVAEVNGVNAQGDGVLAGVMQFLRDKFPVKTAANVAVRARVGVRTAEFWLSRDEGRRRDMGVDAFIALLQSDVGIDVIAAVMAALPKRDRPRWWVRHCNMARVIAIEAAQAQQQNEIKQLRLDMSDPKGR